MMRDETTDNRRSDNRLWQALGHFFVGVCCLSVCCYLLSGSPASASCNQIPGTTNFFRGARGSLDRPFAGPGDPVSISLSPACDAASPGFGLDASAQIVTLAFTPAAGPSRLVVLATDCATIETERQLCGTRGDVAAVACVQADPVVVADAQHLRFRFPNTDALVDAASDEHTLAGPATIAISHTGEPLPCDLAATSCKDHPELIACIDTLFTVDGSCGTTADATFGHFTALPFANDYQALCTDPIPPCTGLASEVRFTVDADGNILLPMDWRGILVGQSVPIARLLRTTFAIEAFPGSQKPIHILGNSFLSSYSPEGGLLPPIFEPQTDASAQNELVLFGTADAPSTILRLARRSPAFRECHGGGNTLQPCTEDAQCGEGNCGPAQCVAGERAGAPCRADTECPGSECGAANFDFATRATQAGGPVVIPRFGAGVCQNSGVACEDDAGCVDSRCVAYRIAAKDPVPLEGLIESKSLFISVVPEAIDGRDLNGDGDTTDDVLLIANRQSGEQAVIGDAAAGRAATRLHQPPFNYPAIAAEDDIVAFLEAEPLQGNRDANSDGDSFDTILRIYRHTDSSTQELTAGLNLAIDADPVINRRSVVISGGRVFFRRRESAGVASRITRASVDNSGVAANGASRRPSLSRDGHHIAFESSSTNLGGSMIPDEPTAYVHDRLTGVTAPIVLRDDVISAGTAVQSPWLSGDGRYVAVSAIAFNEVRQILVYDRDRDRDGIFDEPGAVGSAVINLSNDGNGNGILVDVGDFAFPVISPNGGFLTFSTRAQLGDAEVFSGAVIRTIRKPDANGEFSNDYTSLVPQVASRNGTSNQGAHHQLFQPSALSGDGRFVAFTSFEHGWTGDANNFCRNLGISGADGVTCADIILRDMEQGIATLESVSSTGEQSNNQSLTPAISADGRVIVFESAASNLVAGDTNGAFDVFVRDHVARTTIRASVSSAGQQGNASSFGQALSISDDGRFVAFSSRASNLVADDNNDNCTAIDGTSENCDDVFVHDQLTGFTRRISVTAAGDEGNGRSSYPSISADGATVAFESTASTLVSGSAVCAGSPCKAILVADPDPDAGGDLNGDGDLNDTVLEVFDTLRPERGSRVLGAADQVEIAGSQVAFLVPEAAAGVDLNGDGDTQDRVVHLFHNGEVTNLRRAADDVVISEQLVAVRTAEAAEGNVDLNGDGDTKDMVVTIYDVGEERWSNLQIASAAMAATETGIAFTAIEADQRADLNSDGDQLDRVLQVYSAATHTITSTGQAVEDFVVGPGLVAFRTNEAAQGNRDLNEDGDAQESVLQILDLRSGIITNTAQAAIPCRLAACDARLPYRVLENTVKFLTLEQEQRQDLNGDGDMADLVLQTFNVSVGQRLQRQARKNGSSHMRASRTHRSTQGLDAGALTTIGAISAGICTDSGRACATQSDCSESARCFIPPGNCIEKLSRTCDTLLGDSDCGQDGYCVPTLIPGKGACHVRRGACENDTDCSAPAHCQDAGDSFDRFASPLANASNSGEVFVAGCNPSARPCSDPLLIAAAGDADGDGIADPFDNCARIANPDQRDRNANGVGDVCETTPTATPSATIRIPTATGTSAPSKTPSSTDASGDGCNLDVGTTSGSYRWALLLIAYMLLRNRRRAAMNA